MIDKGHGVVDIFDGSGSYLSQIAGFGSFGSSDPDLAVDNSATASEGNLYVLPEFGPLSAYDSSGTLLYQLTARPPRTAPSATCAAPRSTPAGTSTSPTTATSRSTSSTRRGPTSRPSAWSFNPCDIAVDTDGTIYAIQWDHALHKLDPDRGRPGHHRQPQPQGGRRRPRQPPRVRRPRLVGHRVRSLRDHRQHSSAPPGSRAPAAWTSTARPATSTSPPTRPPAAGW